MPRAGRNAGVGRTAHRPEVLRVLEGTGTGVVLSPLLRRAAGHLRLHKWLRAVGNEKFTGSHMDVVYMGRGSAAREHRVDPVRRHPDRAGHAGRVRGIAPPRQLRPDARDLRQDRRGPRPYRGLVQRGPGRDLSDRFGGRWLTADVHAGDIVTFGLYTLHGSTTNTTNRFRLSCDVRFQPASEPMDERWGGDAVTGHYASAAIPMAESRKQWGL